jgi:hypothetical protein
MIPTYELLKEGEDLRGFTQNALSSFRFFEERVLGRDIQPHHLCYFSDFYSRERTVTEAFRGSGKTTILAVDFPLFMACRDSFERPKRVNASPMNFMVTSPTRKQSAWIIKEVNHLVNKYEFLNWLKPEYKDRKTWNQSILQTTNDCTIYNEVFNQNMRGRHLTHALLDEVSQYKDKQIFYSVIEPMLTMYQGHLMAIGTPWTELDLLAELKENKSGRYFVRRVPAVEDGNPTWPGKYSLEKLKKVEESIPPIEYAREYMLQLIHDEERMITQNDLAYSYDRSQELINFGESDKMYFAGLDLASSPVGDNTVCTILERVGDMLVLRYISIDKGLDFTTHMNLIKDIKERFSPFQIGVDKSGFGIHVINETQIKEQMQIEAIDFTAKSRVDMLTNLARLFSSRAIVIPRKQDGYTDVLTDKLIRELSGMVPTKTKMGTFTYMSTTKHDDCVMSLAISAWLASRIVTASTEGIGETWNNNEQKPENFTEIEEDFGIVWKRDLENHGEHKVFI